MRLFRAKKPVFYIVVLIAMPLLWSCDSRIGQGLTCPEVHVAVRGSIFDQKSLVVVISNAGAKPLFGVGVSCSRWDKKFLISRKLMPGETVEAGWAELPSGFKKGDTAEIFADNYPSPFKVRIE